jgi:hypothetical protein
MGKEEDDRWIKEQMERDKTEQGGVALPPRGTKAQRHQDLLDGLHDTFVRKNHDYGDSFAETFKEFGIISFIVRAQDKWNRIKSLSTDHKSAKVAESLQDTLLDLANYCIMAAMELEEK